jgi:hypothetical protein
MALWNWTATPATPSRKEWRPSLGPFEVADNNSPIVKKMAVVGRLLVVISVQFLTRRRANRPRASTAGLYAECNE